MHTIPATDDLQPLVDAAKAASMKLTRHMTDALPAAHRARLAAAASDGVAIGLEITANAVGQVRVCLVAVNEDGGRMRCASIATREPQAH